MAQLACRGGEPVRQRPFSAWPVQTEQQEEAVCEVVRSGRWSRHMDRNPQHARPAGDASGPWQVDLLEAELAAEIGVDHALAVSSGTAALDLIVRTCDVGPGEEIIVPAYAPIAAATCVLESNAVPVFVDVESDSYTLSRDAVALALTPRTRAVVAYHLGGRLCNMQGLATLAEGRGLMLIEDARQALGSRAPDGAAAGSFGYASAFSFGVSSILSAGEGGLVATSDPDVYERVKVLHDHGLEHEKPGARVAEFGTSARMTEMQAALLRVQLPRLESINQRRQDNVAYFQRAAELVGGLAMAAPVIEGGMQTYQYVVLRYDGDALAGVHRDRFVEALRAEGVPCSIGFPEPLYASPLFRERRMLKDGCPLNCARVGKPVNYDGFKRRCPNAERAAREEAVWLPHRLFLGEHGDVDDVLYAIDKIKQHAEELAEPE